MERNRPKEREYTIEKTLPEKESNFGVFAVAVSVISPQKFTLENLAEVLEVNHKIKYMLLSFFPLPCWQTGFRMESPVIRAPVQKVADEPHSVVMWRIGRADTKKMRILPLAKEY